MGVNIENEIKFSTSDFHDVSKIFDALKSIFIIYPYDKTMLFDVYYDTEDLVLLKNGYTYRIRNKRNRSINFKTSGEIIGGIYSRFEYRDSVDKKTMIEDVFTYTCEANSMAKSIISLYNRQNFIQQLILCSSRTSFLLYYKEGNEIKKFGVCSFDRYFRVEETNEKTYHEIEIETCEENLLPNAFDALMFIKDQFQGLGLQVTTLNKYTTVMMEGFN